MHCLLLSLLVSQRFSAAPAAVSSYKMFFTLGCIWEKKKKSKLITLLVCLLLSSGKAMKKFLPCSVIVSHGGCEGQFFGFGNMNCVVQEEN